MQNPVNPAKLGDAPYKLDAMRNGMPDGGEDNCWTDDDPGFLEDDIEI